MLLLLLLADEITALLLMLYFSLTGGLRGRRVLRSVTAGIGHLFLFQDIRDLGRLAEEIEFPSCKLARLSQMAGNPCLLLRQMSRRCIRRVSHRADHPIHRTFLRSRSCIFRFLCIPQRDLRFLVVVREIGEVVLQRERHRRH